MELPETGEVVTPIDDPCQFNPAWRSIVANYLFMSGVRNKEDLECISRTGGITITSLVEQEEGPPEGDKKDKGRGKKAKKKPKKKTVARKAHSPIAPFDSDAKYRVFASDEYIAKYIATMDDEVSRRAESEDGRNIKLATRWYSEIDHEAAMKKRIEPLLLTGIGMDVIALDLSGMNSLQPAVEAYERLYYNCRDDNFNLNPSMQLIQRMAMPYGPLKTYLKKYEDVDADGFVIGDGRPLAKESDVWRSIGALMGYDALMYYWRWDKKAHGMKNASIKNMMDICWKASVSRLMSDLFTGNIAHEDVARILATFTAHAKFLSDSGKDGGSAGANDTTKALMNILYLAAPKMVQFDEAEEAARNDDIQSRIKSQLAINKQAIEDHGKQVEAEIVDAQIKGAVDG